MDQAITGLTDDDEESEEAEEEEGDSGLSCYSKTCILI